MDEEIGRVILEEVRRLGDRLDEFMDGCRRRHEAINGWDVPTMKEEFRALRNRFFMFMGALVFVNVALALLFRFGG